MPGYEGSGQAKIYGRPLLNEEIPVNKYQKKIIQSCVKVGSLRGRRSFLRPATLATKLVETMFIILKLWVRL